MKPILFNTEMVRGVLDGRKTVTRRVVKPQPTGDGSKPEELKTRPGYWNAWGDDNVYRQPYAPGDILWVRETWAKSMAGTFMYRADGKAIMVERWHPSIHMPREAARIFLRVTDVRAERLQDINFDPPGPENQVVREGLHYLCDFIAVWEGTIKPKDRPTYGWDANPWVWVIEFERIDKGGGHGG